jgi:hypothetical protein
MIKVISTGVEGPERAALDAAIQHGGVEWGGACPLGRSGQYGPIPDKYFTEEPNRGLVEGSSSRPAQARFANARGSDATLILSPSSAILPRSCKDIIITLRRKEGDYRIVDPRRTYEVKQVVKWIALGNLRILNIAAEPKRDDDPFTTRSLGFMRDILTYTTLYEHRGVKIWT